ncbi:hypothetical protein SIM22_05235 [Bacillus cereus group sp. BfR-BA-01363]|uniref:hypothetical protein n=1 Tax=Bacillus cereus group sp. BfR-BA-01363 TaxID=3094882 RepID=UPI0029C59FB0|nr:hypothetical protein [Bacillus cereus group sp. BfR-BA-01363]MDX5853536.1 hypothetical protein [Bacillus cereus group sp. BfR-BA-01363]
MSESVKKQLKVYGKRIGKIILVILVIKYIRFCVAKSEISQQIISQLSEHKSQMTMEHLVRWGLATVFIFVFFVLIIGLLIYKMSFLEKKLCNYLIIFLFTEPLLYFVFPEIPIALMKSIVFMH